MPSKLQVGFGVMSAAEEFKQHSWANVWWLWPNRAVLTRSPGWKAGASLTSRSKRVAKARARELLEAQVGPAPVLGTVMTVQLQLRQLFGAEPDWLRLGVTTAASFLVFVLGYAFFMKTKRGFADVL